MKIQPFRLERYFAEHEFSAPYSLCASDAESMTIADLLAFEPEAQEKLVSLWLGYTETLGAPELRQAVTHLYEEVEEEHILVHSGAEEAIFNFMNVAVESGDHVIVQAPFYQALGEVAQSCGAEVTEWRGDPQRSWALDLEVLQDALTPRTKIVVVNLPHNPTGYLPTTAFVQELSALSEKHGFVIFSDEVYRGLEHHRGDRLPGMADLNARAVSLGVMSKAYGLAGLRIGWIATRDPELFRKLAAFKDYTTICNSAPSEFLATLALRHADAITQRNVQIIRTNLALLDNFFASNQELFQWYRPKAGSIAFPQLLRGNVDTFCAELIEKIGVLLLPGTLYGPDYNAFRIGFGRQNLPDVLGRLEEYVSVTEAGRHPLGA
jgi:aspartate/methionine/tyrosine aminotransferase